MTGHSPGFSWAWGPESGWEWPLEFGSWGNLGHGVKEALEPSLQSLGGGKQRVAMETIPQQPTPTGAQRSFPEQKPSSLLGCVVSSPHLHLRRGCGYACARLCGLLCVGVLAIYVCVWPLSLHISLVLYRLSHLPFPLPGTSFLG